MKTIIFAPYALSASHHELALEYALDHISQGWETHVVICPKAFLTCDQNYKHKWLRCEECHTVSKKSLETIHFPKERIHKYELTEAPSPSEFPTFTHLEELKKYTFDSIPAGKGVASSLVSGVTRDVAPDMKKNDAFIRKALSTYIGVYRYSQQLFRQIQPDKVYFFHGRSSIYNATLMAARAEGIECEIGERENYKSYIIIPNTHCIDLKHCNAEILKYKEMFEQDPNGVQIAETWFTNCLKGKHNLHNLYTFNESNEIPMEAFSKKRLNVGIFSSSEDETIVEESWKNNVFDTQADGIHYICSQLSENTDIHFYLRIHPNLKGLNSTQEKRLLALARIPNLTVIPADSTMNSYKLLMACDTVVSFGSTIGIEAVYWGKPVVLIGPSFYRPLEACYTPTTKEELIQLLNKKLSPKPRELSLPYAYWWSQRNRPFKFIETQDPKNMNASTYNGENISKPSWLIYRINQIRFYLQRYLTESFQ